MKRTVSPVFMSRWKGNSAAIFGSLMAWITLESLGCVNPGRLIHNVPLWLCADGRYWFDWNDRSEWRRGDIRFWLTSS